MSKRGPPQFKKGDQVQVFYRFEHDGSGDGGESYFPVMSPDAGLFSPRLGLTDSWQSAVVLEDFDASAFRPDQRSTWVRCHVVHNRWSNRKGTPLDLSDPHNTTVSFIPGDVRYPVPEYRPTVSFFVARWGGPYPVPTHADDGEFGGWGDIGTCICDRYINSFFTVVYQHLGPTYEVLSCFVSHSADLTKVYGPGIAGMMKGSRRAGLYYLWPVGWMDCNEGQTGYVEKAKFFEFMQSMEAAGIPSRHPHPSNLYHLFASKSWTASMCLSKEFNVPCTTKVNRAEILDNPREAAASALDALQALRRMKYGEAATQGGVNALAGVAKLGFSWEAQDVLAFKGLEQLSQRLERLLDQAGCTAECIYVQEMVPNDCEIRVYLVDGIPRKHLYSRFCEVDGGGSFSSFRRYENRALVVKDWFHGNDEGLKDAERQIEELTERWLVWLRAECSVPPAVCRMDFFIKLEGPTAVVATGELTEQGASMLGWKEGPRLTFEAVLRQCVGGSYSRQIPPPQAPPVPTKRRTDE